jgi:hypothetical protein
MYENVLVTPMKVKTLYKQQTSHIFIMGDILNNTQTNLDLRNTALRHGFHFQHRNSKTFPIESLAHDSGRSLVRAEHQQLKKKSAATALNTVLASAHTQMT